MTFHCDILKVTFSVVQFSRGVKTINQSTRSRVRTQDKVSPLQSNPKAPTQRFTPDHFPYRSKLDQKRSSDSAQLQSQSPTPELTAKGQCQLQLIPKFTTRPADWFPPIRILWQVVHLEICHFRASHNTRFNNRPKDISLSYTTITSPSSSAMLFKSLRRRSTTSKASKPLTPIELATTKQEAESPVITTMNSQECRDYEVFLENARKEEEKKEKALEKAIRDADKRRRMMDMDPWAKRAGGW